MAAAHRRTALRGGSSVAERAEKEKKSGKHRKPYQNNVRKEEILMLFCLIMNLFFPFFKPSCGFSENGQLTPNKTHLLSTKQ